MNELVYDWGIPKPHVVNQAAVPKQYVFDIETNGFLEDLDRIHCMWISDFVTGQKWGYRPHEIKDGLAKLDEANLLVGHNIIAFDIQALHKVYGWKPKCPIFDTLTASRAIWSNIKEQDFALHRRGKISAGNIGRHNLESWGERLGVLKGDYGKTSDWTEFTEEMFTYCQQDVVVNEHLYNRILMKNVPASVLRMEQDIHTICLDQERFGFPFNEREAQKLLAKLLARKAELYDSIYKQLGPCWVVGVADVTSKRTVRYKDPLRGNEIAGADWTKIKVVEFNPNSRAHLGKRLMEVFKWEPTEFGEDGLPTLDDEVLDKLTMPIAKEIGEFLMIQKRLGQLAEGNQAWLSLVKDGKIHGRVNTMGAITARCTHSHPNLAQIPSNSAPYGKECRALFGVENGEYLVGSDVSGLELRMLAHYMAMYDGGAYGEIILNGDIHTANQQAAGLPTRNNAKTFIYGFLYGAGDAKIAEIIGGTARQGKALKDKFLNNTPALKQLREAVANKVKATGTLKALDGRILPVRHQHAALNTLLQSAGAIVCKMWVIQFHQLMREAGYVHGVHYKQAAFVHDELQIRVCAKTFPLVDGKSFVGDMCKQAIKQVGEILKVRLPLDGEYAVGKSYAETH